MLRLRPFKPCDAGAVISWIQDETTFLKWSAGRFGAFPITPEDINAKYFGQNGDCPEPDNFYPMTAFDDIGVVGHMILRFTDTEKTVLRFGFVIVDSSKCGYGYGKEMIRLALKYAFQILGAQKVTIGAFENNPGAVRCYQAAGFHQVGMEAMTIQGEIWNCIELETTK